MFVARRQRKGATGTGIGIVHQPPVRPNCSEAAVSVHALSMTKCIISLKRDFINDQRCRYRISSHNLVRITRDTTHPDYESRASGPHFELVSTSSRTGSHRVSRLALVNGGRLAPLLTEPSKRGVFQGKRTPPPGAASGAAPRGDAGGYAMHKNAIYVYTDASRVR